MSNIFHSIRRVLLLLGIEVLVSGNEVGHKIGNPTNIDIKSEPESASMSTSSNPYYQS